MWLFTHGIYRKQIDEKFYSISVGIKLLNKLHFKKKTQDYK
jgi:hypothetical protein